MPFKIDIMRENHLCIQMPYAEVFCGNNYLCNHCEIADRIRRNTGEVICERPLFGWRDALPQTPGKKGETWYRMPVILSPEAMDRLGLEPILKNQIIIAEGGPGCLKANPYGEIDAFLYSDIEHDIFVNRFECYGMPNRSACEVYDSYFGRFGRKKLFDFFDFPPLKPKYEYKYTKINKKRRDGH